MTLTNSPLVKSLWKFANNFVEQHKKVHSCLPVVEIDESWPSVCQQTEQDEENIYWQPTKSPDNLSFENIEAALEISLHQDFKIYFSTFFSESIDAESEDGKLSLLFAWNLDDFQRLQENLIGHVLMKKRLKQKTSLFFAVTDEEDMILSVLNDSGEVWVERVGCEPHKKLANSLSEFIDQLSPVIA
ncbi:MAG: SecY-interacting protein [Colwellia sp.]|nr:SecY-interacting protein [Colwellia sp.]